MGTSVSEKLYFSLFYEPSLTDWIAVANNFVISLRQMARTFKIKYSLELLLHAVSQRLLYSKWNLRIKHENKRVFEACAVDVV